MALSQRHYFIGLSSTIYLLALVVLLIVHDIMWEIECDEDILVNPAVVSVVLGLTLAMVVLAAVLPWTLSTRSYGLATDLGDLSGLASLIDDSDILLVLQDNPAY
jgi:hypothetical protein